ncbi:MAG TPA: DUF2493 domain-containing protein [Jiangellaceae bacterium]
MSKETFRVLVTGSRKWKDQDTIRKTLDIVAEQALRAGCSQVVVVHGCAPGADIMADYWARNRRQLWPLTAERHPADWRQYGKAAGIRRNREMVKAGADVCLAFVLDDSKGATQCGELAEREGIPTRWFKQYSTNPPGETDGREGN